MMATGIVQSTGHVSDEGFASGNRRSAGRSAQGTKVNAMRKRVNPPAWSVAAEQVRRYGAVEVEEEASVGPLLEPWESRHNHGRGPGQLPWSKDKVDVERVPEMPQLGPVKLDLQQGP